MSARDLAERLSDQGVMRLRLDRRPPDLLDAIRAVAPRAVWAGDVVVPGPTAARPVVLDRVRATGAGIVALTVEEGRLDFLYRELVRPAGSGPGRAS